jgi:NAD(P)-dependent dehydrogenase (short-subunit alcohol dehydrogenase family)
MTKYTIKYLIKSKGTIINNASIAGLNNYNVGQSYAYSVSKSAVIKFSNMIAKNYAHTGITCNVISPGIIQTKMLGDRNLNLLKNRIPSQELGKVSDIAECVVFLSKNKYINGTNLIIDGGLSL